MSKKNLAAAAVKNAARNVARRDATEKTAAATRENKNVASATNVVDFPASSNVGSEGSVGMETSAAPTATALTGSRKMELTRINHNRKGSNIVFSLGNGYRGTAKFARSLFGESVPEKIAIDAPFAQASTPKAKLGKEERAALRAAETPQMKVQKAKERAKKAAERAAKLEASLSATV